MTTCHLCGESAMHISELPARIQPFVTSDFRPWAMPFNLAFCTVCRTVQKCLSPAWKQEVAACYATYDPYPLGKRIEQGVFSTEGIATVRSALWLRAVGETLSLPEVGRMLDVGCGDGALIKTFGQLYPGWCLNGADVSEKFAASICSLPGVEAFYAADPHDVDGCFDLVTFSHVLEHIVDPLTWLEAWRRKLARGGHIVIEVPDCEANPFDLVIADHATHFSEETLAALVYRAGFTVNLLSRVIVPKELTLVASLGNSGIVPRSVLATDFRFRHVQWLVSLASQALVAAKQPMAIFGTSIAGSWVDGVIKGRGRYFLDEDRSRAGSVWRSLPVLTPEEADQDVPVLIPLIPAVAAMVKERLVRHGLKILLPPPL